MSFSKVKFFDSLEQWNPFSFLSEIRTLIEASLDYPDTELEKIIAVSNEQFAKFYTISAYLKSISKDNKLKKQVLHKFNKSVNEADACFEKYLKYISCMVDGSFPENDFKKISRLELVSKKFYDWYTFNKHVINFFTKKNVQNNTILPFPEVTSTNHFNVSTHKVKRFEVSLKIREQILAFFASHQFTISSACLKKFKSLAYVYRLQMRGAKSSREGVTTELPFGALGNLSKKIGIHAKESRRAIMLSKEMREPLKEWLEVIQNSKNQENISLRITPKLFHKTIEAVASDFRNMIACPKISEAVLFSEMELTRYEQALGLDPILLSIDRDYVKKRAAYKPGVQVSFFINGNPKDDTKDDIKKFTLGEELVNSEKKGRESSEEIDYTDKHRVFSLVEDQTKVVMMGPNCAYFNLVKHLYGPDKSFISLIQYDVVNAQGFALVDRLTHSLKSLRWTHQTSLTAAEKKMLKPLASMIAKMINPADLFTPNNLSQENLFLHRHTLVCSKPLERRKYEWKVIEEFICDFTSSHLAARQYLYKESGFYALDYSTFFRKVVENVFSEKLDFKDIATRYGVTAEIGEMGQKLQKKIKKYKKNYPDTDILKEYKETMSIYTL